jgi:chemotaxis response regulator CheB
MIRVLLDGSPDVSVPGVAGRSDRAVKGEFVPDVAALDVNVVVSSGRSILAAIFSMQHMS